MLCNTGGDRFNANIWSLNEDNLWLYISLKGKYLMKSIFFCPLEHIVTLKMYIVYDNTQTYTPFPHAGHVWYINM